MNNEREEMEWALTQVLLNPVLFREFINDGDPNWDGLEQHERAWTACTSNRMAMCCGRSVHKTTTMIEMLYWWVITGNFIRGDQPNLFVMVPNKAQKDLSFGKIASACRTHWLVQRLVDKNRINVSEGRIDFLNGFQFILRIAGAAGSEDNVIGVHTTKIWVDEAQEFPWRTWQSLLNCLKFEIEDHRMIVSGVPNGERKDNVLYTCDELDENYTSFNISQEMMSWWTKEIELDRRKQYHAVQEDSEEYKHFVLGQHGVPTYSIFDRVRFKKEDYMMDRIVITQEMCDRVRTIDANGDPMYELNRVFTLPPLPPHWGLLPKVGVGYDVGYSPDPAVFFLMVEDPKTGLWKNPLRLVLQRVEYGIQREVLMYLDKTYNLDFIGIDMGGPGKVQYQDLTGDFISQKIKAYNFRDRIFPVDFGASIAVAVREEDGELVEKKDQTKRVAVETVSRWTQESHRFVFASDDDNLMWELERTKFRRNPVGDPIYVTEDDHQFAAMMTAIMAYENRFGVGLAAPRLEVKAKLLKAKWLDPHGVL